MNLPFCYKTTHPTITLILRELEKRPRTSIELSSVFSLTHTHIRDALGWMHRQKLVRICAWVLTSKRALTRVWALREGKLDAVKPKNKRTRRHEQ